MGCITQYRWIIVAVFAIPTLSYGQPSYPFQNPDLRLEQRVTNILSLMTVEESGLPGDEDCRSAP
jgi:hypothetical protein